MFKNKSILSIGFEPIPPASKTGILTVRLRKAVGKYFLLPKGGIEPPFSDFQSDILTIVLFKQCIEREGFEPSKN